MKTTVGIQQSRKAQGRSSCPQQRIPPNKTIKKLIKKNDNKAKKPSKTAQKNARIRCKPVPSDGVVRCDNHILVLEVMNKKWTEQKEVNIQNVKFDGGLHTSRIKWIKKVYLIHCTTKRQLYIARQLNLNPHYMVHKKDLTLFKNDLKHNNITYEVIESSQNLIPTLGEDSNMEDIPLMVVNEHGFSPDMIKEFDAINLCDIGHMLADSSKKSNVPSERGNNQMSSGYATENQPRDPNLFDMAKPEKTTDNNCEEPMKERAIRMTRFIAATATAYPIVHYMYPNFTNVKVTGINDQQKEENFENRYNIFAKSYEEGNIGEAMTSGASKVQNGDIDIHNLNCLVDTLLRCHVDKFNDNTEGYCYQFVISQVFEVEDDNNESGDKIDDNNNERAAYRFFHAMYWKKCCADFIDRYNWTAPVMETFKEYKDEFNNLDEKTEIPLIFASYQEEIKQAMAAGDEYIIIRRLPTKQVLHSNFALPILKLHEKFTLYEHQVFELAYASTFVTTNLMFHKVIMHWINKGEPLPTDVNLVEFFVETSRELGEESVGDCPKTCKTPTKKNQGQFISAPGNTKYMTNAVIEDALGHFIPAIKGYFEKRKLNKYSKNMHSIFQGALDIIQNHLPGVGPLLAHNFLMILVHTRIIDWPCLTEYAVLSKDTATWKKIVAKMSSTGHYNEQQANRILKEKSDMLLRTAAAFCKKTVAIAEHMMCKAFQPPNKTHSTKDDILRGKISQGDVIFVELVCIEFIKDDTMSHVEAPFRRRLVLHSFDKKHGTSSQSDYDIEPWQSTPSDDVSHQQRRRYECFFIWDKKNTNKDKNRRERTVAPSSRKEDELYTNEHKTKTGPKILKEWKGPTHAAKNNKDHDYDDDNNSNSSRSIKKKNTTKNKSKKHTVITVTSKVYRLLFAISTSRTNKEHWTNMDHGQLDGPPLQCHRVMKRTIPKKQKKQ